MADEKITVFGPQTSRTLSEMARERMRKGARVKRDDDVSALTGVPQAGLFPIDVEAHGGAWGGQGGTAGQRCSWKYTAYPRGRRDAVLDGNLDVNDDEVGHVYARPAIGSLSKATRGVAFVENGKLVVTYLNELKIYSTCEEELTSLNQEVSTALLGNIEVAPPFDVVASSLTLLATGLGDSVPYPAGLSSGDVLVMFGITDDSTTLTSPASAGVDSLTTGPSVLNGTRRTQAFYRIINGSESANFGVANNFKLPSTNAVYGYIAYKGVSRTAVNYSDGQAGLTAPSKAYATNELAIAIFGEASDTSMGAPDSGFVSGVNLTDATEPTAVQVAAYQGDGATLAPTVTGGSTSPASLVLSFT